MTIRTLTLSPALDYAVSVTPSLKLGDINRTSKEEFSAGGKGINVSIVLKRLGYPSIALGFLSGFTGDYIEKLLKDEKLDTDFVHTKGITRINVKIEGEEETAINGKGPSVTNEELEMLVSRLKKMEDGDVLVMSGQIPPTLPSDTYEKILEGIYDKKVLTIVDSTGKLLTDSLKYHPFLIKPNVDELSEIFNKKISNDDEIIFYCKELQKLGARNVLISKGGNGALLLTEEGKSYSKSAMNGKVISTVGSGDSMVAGFLAGYLRYHDYEQALLLALSTGSATAFKKGLADKEDVDAIMTKMYGKKYE